MDVLKELEVPVGRPVQQCQGDFSMFVYEASEAKWHFDRILKSLKLPSGVEVKPGPLKRIFR